MGLINPFFINTPYCAVLSRILLQHNRNMAKEQLQKELQRFGFRVRQERLLKDVTQEKLAELAQLNVRTIQKIEAGQTNILITTAKRLKKAIGCSWESLLD